MRRESSKSGGNASSFVLPEVGEVVAGKYRIKELIGQGSNGTTYAAQKLDSPTEELVALKVLSLRGSKDWKAIELFEREARVLSQLDHPGMPSTNPMCSFICI
jgi:serine/threonine protein kinase